MHDFDEKPLILGFVADLMFQTRIENTAEQLDFKVRWIESAEPFATPDDERENPAGGARTGRQLGEHLVGPGAVLIDRVTQWRPALMIFDLNNTAVPWRDWITLLTSVSATRRIPVICFGSHVDVQSMAAARAAGAQAVLARSRFVSDLPNLIQKHARLPDRKGLEEACREPLDPLAERGLQEFNRGEYFEAHESLEHAWMADEGPGRDLYRAILQVAVAYYHIQGGNYNGAAKMFLRMRQWLDPLPERCRGVDVARLRKEAKEVHRALLDLGPERLAELDRRLLRPVAYVQQSTNID